MSELQKTTKININLKSSGTFLNINKPKYLSLGKSSNINNIKVKKKDINISQDSFRIENITRQTESSSKDEIIRALKERLTILEKKVKILEIEKKDNSLKTNILNLSHGNNKNMNKEMKLNIKVFKNKKKFTNVLNLSHSEIYKKRDKNCLYKNKKSFNIDVDKKNKLLNKKLCFFNSINTSGYHTNIDKIKSKMKISKSVSKYKNFKNQTSTVGKSRKLTLPRRIGNVTSNLDFTLSFPRFAGLNLIFSATRFASLLSSSVSPLTTWVSTTFPFSSIIQAIIILPSTSR